MGESLTIVGAGRVGRALGRRLREVGWKIGTVVTRNDASARRAVRFIGAGNPHGGLTRQVLNCTVILVATPDSAVRDVGEELARIGAEELDGKIVLHTSGALDASELDAVRAFGAAAASMHPLQSFSGVGAPQLEGKIFAIEGDVAAVRKARQIAHALGGAPLRIGGDNKPLYHAAAAMAAGHVLALVEAAAQLLMSVGMNRREAVRALLPLARQVLQNFERLGSRAAWTGPLSRGDYGVVQAHTRALQKVPKEFLNAYEAMNRLAALVLAQDTAGALAKLDGFSGSKDAKAKAKATGGNA
jgi:predicted short-subunit dehydrogenase-like oxidoreductase (DUF2520 family)